MARIKNTRTPFSIDFGVGDVIVPKQEKRKIPTQLDDFTAPVVNTYSLETTIAEKIDAILSFCLLYTSTFTAGDHDFGHTETYTTYISRGPSRYLLKRQKYS